MIGVADKIAPTQTKPSQPTWLERLDVWLFPQHYLPPLGREAGFAAGDLQTVTYLRFTGWDRLRIAISGKALLQMRTKTDVPVRKVKSASVVDVQPPWYQPPDRTP